MKMEIELIDKEKCISEFQETFLDNSLPPEEYNKIVDMIDFIHNQPVAAKLIETKAEDSLNSDINPINTDQDKKYYFEITLLTNNIDRDYESFSVDALKQISELCIGKTIICSNTRSNKDIQARIEKTWLEKNNGQFTIDGYQVYTLKAKAYIPICNENIEIIKNIDNGALQEVSIACSVDKTECSICGKDIRSGKCNHIAGNVYNDKRCIRHLINVTDVYEFAFVESLLLLSHQIEKE